MGGINSRLNDELFALHTEEADVEVTFDAALRIVVVAILKELQEPTVQARLSAPPGYDLEEEFKYTDASWLNKLPQGTMMKPFLVVLFIVFTSLCPMSYITSQICHFSPLLDRAINFDGCIFSGWTSICIAVE